MTKNILILGLTCLIDHNILANETCTLISSELYGLTGDIEGKRVYTKEEFTYECTTTTTKRGTCKSWEEVKQDYNVSGLKNDVYYQTENFQGSIGQAIATAQGYDKINGLWSGWHGLCQDGVDDGNWDWAGDPYVLGGFALSAFGATGGFGLADGNYIEAGTEFYSQAALEFQEAIVKYATCSARAGLDIGTMIEDSQSNDEECDPVDEICGAEEAAAAKQEAKEEMLKIQGTAMTLQLASCVAGYDAGSGSFASSTDDASSLLSANSVASMTLGAINPLLGLAFQVGDKMYESLTSSIDTCHNEDDAKEKGSRHEATYHSLPLGLCHQIEVVKKGSPDIGTEQRIFRYCCYDDKSTRILVEQAKAQFAKGWEHCTDMTLTELAVMSFASCDGEELDSSIDGTKLSAYATTAERMKAYQFTHKCIDTREYTKVLLDKFAGDDMLIDTNDIEELLEGLK